MQLTSHAFRHGEPIPAQYTGEGRNISPPLNWSDAPAGTKSFALIVDDPDARSGMWVHWVVYNLPASASELPEETARSQYLPGGAMNGLTDFKQLGYGGPMPPPGKPHRYFFKLYALDEVLDLKPGLTKKQIEQAMTTHVLGRAEVIGTYERY